MAGGEAAHGQAVHEFERELPGCVMAAGECHHFVGQSHLPEGNAEVEVGLGIVVIFFRSGQVGKGDEIRASVLGTTFYDGGQHLHAELEQEIAPKLAQILTPEQQKKFDKILSEVSTRIR